MFQLGIHIFCDVTSHCLYCIIYCNLRDCCCSQYSTGGFLFGKNLSDRAVTVTPSTEEAKPASSTEKHTFTETKVGHPFNETARNERTSMLYQS